MGRRWLGPKHAHKVSVNPLNFTWKIEDTKRCIRCERVLHKRAFEYLGRVVGVCSGCRKDLLSP